MKTSAATVPSSRAVAMSKRCTGRNRQVAKVGFAALVALARRTAADSSDSASLADYVTRIGCYRDKKERAMEFMANTPNPTKETCVVDCMAGEYQYMGLEYGQECFCGDSYDMYGPVEPGTDFKCSMELKGDSGVEAGGWWALTVYDLQGAYDQHVGINSANARSNGTGSSHSDGANTGGATNVTTPTPVPSGERAFTVVNKCSQTIRIGSTGGRITFGDGKDDKDKALCDAWGKSAVYNPGPMGIGCFWDFPPEASGNTDRMLEPGKSFRYNLYETESNVRWSGTIWASTGCDRLNGCLTGVCYSPETNYICPAYVGPGGPTTKAEFTLSDSYKDYYDVSNIDGTNLPMMISPDNPVFPSPEQQENQNIKKYECGSPGAPTAHLSSLDDCTWSYDHPVPTMEGHDMSKFVRLVYDGKDVVPNEKETCESDNDCGAGRICGVLPQRWANGAYKGGVKGGSCGEHIAWVSAGGACAGGWETGVFPDAHPFHCGASVEFGMRANMYGCHGGEYAHSGYTPNAADTSCGCPDWTSEPYNMKTPAISECNGVNPEWVELAMPWAGHQKKACPTAYTFPYDDQTSTFTCFDGDGPGSSPDYVNTQSYTITFCPGDSESAMYG